MLVQIFSRKEAISLIKKGYFPDGTAVISFCDRGTKPSDRVDYSSVCDRVMYIELDDLGYDDLAEEGYTYDSFFPEAEEAAEFIVDAFNDDFDIVCQCEYGESRSAGCAAAIEEHFFHNGIYTFQDFDYYPNKMIYHKIYDALQTMEKRVELHAHTNMSQMEGLSSVEELIERAQEDGQPAIAITDNGVVQAFPEAACVAKNYGVKIIYGMECTLSDMLPVQSTLVVLAKNQTGLKNLYKLVSWSHIENSIGIGRTPRVTKEKLTELREGLLIGSGSETGWLYRAIEEGRSEEELLEIARFFDYLEICPSMSEENALIIADLGWKLDIPVCAAGNVYHGNSEKEITRHILLNDEPRYMNSVNPDCLYLRETEEMINEFAYLGRGYAYRVVVTNTKRIAAMIEELHPIPQGKYLPTIDGAEEELKEVVYRYAGSFYGDPIPNVIKSRLDKELELIISNGFATHYIIATRLADSAARDDHIFAFGGGIGASLVAYFAEITQINPLPPHYYCPFCHHFEISEETAGSGYDLPEKTCPECGTVMKKDGHNIPFETFAGVIGDKEPYIEVRFGSSCKEKAENTLRSMFDENKVFRTGTISTLKMDDAEKIVRNYSRKYSLDWKDDTIEHFTSEIVGIKKETRLLTYGYFILPKGHDAEDFTPLQYTEKNGSKVLFTHFNMPYLSRTLTKVNLLTSDNMGMLDYFRKCYINTKISDIPMDDPKVYSLFSSPGALGVTADDIFFKTGALAIPVFDEPLINDISKICKPKNFSELLKVFGLAHGTGPQLGTGIWHNNAEKLIVTDRVTLDQIIAFRDDITNELTAAGIKTTAAAEIAEVVGHSFHNKLDEGHEMMMRRHNIPEWYIDSMKKISYLFPKAHAAEFIRLAVIFAWHKLYYPRDYYEAYFDYGKDHFISPEDIETTRRGKDEIRKRIIAAENANRSASVTALKVANEAICRGVDLDEIIE